MQNIMERNKTADKFYKYIDKFFSMSAGKQKLNEYISLCNVTPKNIYTDEINWEERYKNEYMIIWMCISYFYKNGFCIDNIYKEIPELKYYKKIFEFKEYVAINYENFEIMLAELNNKLFKNINPREYGEYYTSLEITNLALSKLTLDYKQKIIDPSCGSGFILYSYLERLLYLYPNIDKNEIFENVYGYDIFPFAIITTKLLLGYKLWRHGHEKVNVFKFKNILINNTLSFFEKRDKIVEDKFDLIVGNPPYFRIDPKQGNKMISDVNYGHSYSHSLFVQWSLLHCVDNGKICLFLPESILSGYYYQKLRKSILKNSNISLIILNKEYEEKFNVQQEIMVLLLDKDKDEKKKYYTIEIANSNTRFNLPQKILNNTNNVIPTIKNNVEYNDLIKLAKNKNINALNKIYLSTGNFVWNQNKEYCFKEKRKNAIPLITGKNIKNNKIDISDNKKINYCITNNPVNIKKEPAIVFKRMSPINYENRFMGTIINTDKISHYVVENHVNIINAINMEELSKAYEVLISSEFNTAINIFCHTNQLSINDVKTIIEVVQELS